MRKTWANMASAMLVCFASPSVLAQSAASNPGLDKEVQIVRRDGADSYIRASTCELLGLGPEQRDTKSRIFYSSDEKVEHRLDVLAGSKHVVIGLFDFETRKRCFYLTDASAVLLRAVCGRSRDDAQVVDAKRAARAFRRELEQWRETLADGR